MEFGDILRQGSAWNAGFLKTNCCPAGNDEAGHQPLGNEKARPAVSVVSDFAEKLGVPSSALSGETPLMAAGDAPRRRAQARAILGSAACGEPIYKPGDGTEFISVEDDLPCDFALIAQGDSMTGDRHLFRRHRLYPQSGSRSGWRDCGCRAG